MLSQTKLSVGKAWLGGAARRFLGTQAGGCGDDEDIFSLSHEFDRVLCFYITIDPRQSVDSARQKSLESNEKTHHKDISGIAWKTDFFKECSV